MALPTPQFWRFITALTITSFTTNWIWEMGQMTTFVEMAGIPWLATSIRCTVAALGDVAITLGICALGSLAVRDPNWGCAQKWNVAAFAVIMGWISGMAFEWFSLATGRWTYNSHMPIVPVLKIGLWPLLQVSILTPASFWLSPEICRRIKSEGDSFSTSRP